MRSAIPLVKVGWLFVLWMGQGVAFSRYLFNL